MSKQIKKIKNKLFNKYIKFNKNKSSNGEVSLLVGISQLHH